MRQNIARYTEKTVAELSLVSSGRIITGFAHSNNPDYAPVISLAHQEYFGRIGRIITARASISNYSATALTSDNPDTFFSVYRNKSAPVHPRTGRTGIVRFRVCSSESPGADRRVASHREPSTPLSLSHQADLHTPETRVRSTGANERGSACDVSLQVSVKLQIQTQF